MDKFLIRKGPIVVEQPINNDATTREEPSSSKQPRIEINLNDLHSDPGLRKRIYEFHPNDRDKIRRFYLQKGPCQPKDHDFPKRKVGSILRRFVPSWFEVSSFCEKNNINVPNMDNMFVDAGRSRRNSQNISNLHHYQVEYFYTIVDMQLQELNNRFTETNSELLLCVACLNPMDSFVAFDKLKLIRLAQLYPCEFSKVQIAILEDQLKTYIFDMRSDNRFAKVKGIGDLAKILVETRKNALYPLVYLLLKLALILPVATASVERVFSAMNLVKTRLRNRLGDAFLNDCLVTYIEREIFDSIDNEKIIQGYQNMKSRREQL